MDHIRPTLDKIMTDALRRAPAAEAPLLAWSVVAGATVAERTRALDFRAGVLRIEVPDTTWRSELLSLAPRYVVALNRVSEGVERIEFVLKSSH
ncbi:MAG TPA: DciA family protein [Terriglobales bacterium]|nr:DciA family protein [Terriglobales bacterium]